MRVRRLLAVLISLSLGASVLAIVSAASATATPAPPSKTIRTMHLRTTTDVGTMGAAHVAAPHTARPDSKAALRAELRNQTLQNRSLSPRTRVLAPRSLTPARTSAPRGPAAKLSKTLAFEGINHFISRYGTDNGNNHYSLEPPDQGLCAGNGQIFEIVNEAVQVYSSSDGSPLLDTPLDVNTFFDYPPQIVRPSGPFGPNTFDPSCVYDTANGGHFFVLTAVYYVDQNTGAPSGVFHLDLAVSKTNDATGQWSLYSLPVQDDGTEGTPNHNCAPDPGYPGDGATNPTACFGDYPHLGIDSNGFYMTTNEYDFFGPNFHAAQVYALPKIYLEQGLPNIAVVQFDTVGVDHGNPGFTLWPSSSSSPKNADNRGSGTEWFLSSNAAAEANGSGSSSDLLTWALTNTKSLTATENVSLLHADSTVMDYSIPPLSWQPPGDFPLGQCLNDQNEDDCETYLGFGSPSDPPEVEQPFDSSDTRMLTTWYENGVLYGALDTAAEGGDGPVAGIEWFQLRPHVAHGAIDPNVQSNGVLRKMFDNVTYPTIAVNSDGVGAMGYTISGDHHYPSTAYSVVSKNKVGPVRISQEGLGPDDGFTWYNAYEYVRPRWGDYGAAATLGKSVVLANEWIAQTCDLTTFENTYFVCPDANHPDGSRTALANWSTGITVLSP